MTLFLDIALLASAALAGWLALDIPRAQLARRALSFGLLDGGGSAGWAGITTWDDLDGFSPSYELAPGASMRAFCCVSFALAGMVALAAFPGTAGYAAAAWSIACLLFCASAAACDLKARVIPRETCWAGALLGGTWQLLAWGAASLAATVAVALFMWGVVTVFTRNAAQGSPMMGAGDPRALAAAVMLSGIGPAVDGGGMLSGLVAGNMACPLLWGGLAMLAALVCSYVAKGAARPRRGSTASELIPLAPYLAVLVAAGMLSLDLCGIQMAMGAAMSP